MGSTTGIEWTNATWNPIRGCSRVSQGCVNCYAETIAARFSDAGQPFHLFADRNKSGSKWTGKLALVEKHLQDPLRWREPRRIFANSMSDLFHENLPDESIDQVFAVMSLATQHQFQILTKRPARMLAYLTQKNGRRVVIPQAGPRSTGGAIWTHTASWPLPNVWLGVSVEDQKTADERIPVLSQTPAAVRFVSAEPLLGPIDLMYPETLFPDGPPRCCNGHDCGCMGKPTEPPLLYDIDWLICGGESGPGARPMHPTWARNLRDQCMATGVAFFFKQWGAFASVSEVAGPGDFHEFEDGATVRRIGKKAAGALLDGKRHQEFPIGKS